MKITIQFESKYARNKAILTSCALLVAAVALVRAGDLNPPSGPIAPTMKTLTQVEPRTPIQTLGSLGTAQYVINAPGSYYLTGNLTGVSGKMCIAVNASDVTIDLNGFALEGVAGSGAAISTTSGNQSAISIKNGVIRGFHGGGVQLDTCFSIQLDSLRFTQNQGGAAARLGGKSVVQDCVLYSNYGGVEVLFKGVIRRTHSYNSDPGLLFGVADVLIEDCSVDECNGDAFSVQERGRIRNCSASNVNGAGALASASTVVENLNASFCLWGVRAVGTGAEVTGCHINNSTNGGIRVECDDSKISQNVVTFSNGPAIKVETGFFRNFISGNRIHSNTLGITSGAGNIVGPTIDVSSGTNITTIPDSGHPLANLKY